MKLRIDRVPETIKEADIIIIDEISMCRIDLFDYVIRVIMKAEQISLKRKQVIVVGDFFNYHLSQQNLILKFYHKSIQIMIKDLLLNQKIGMILILRWLNSKMLCDKMTMHLLKL